MEDPEISTIAAIATPPGDGGIGVIRISGPRARYILGKVFRPSAKNFVDFIPWKLHRGVIADENGAHLDDALAVYMPGPATFTGEDVAELQCHGGSLLLEKILEAVFRCGAKPAARGEFSKRAFLNGKMDLSQAEAIAEVIAAPSREALEYGFKRLKGYLGKQVESLREKIDDLRVQVCVGIDFPDDEVSSLMGDAVLEKTREISKSIATLLKGASRAETMQTGARVVLAGPVNAGKSSLLNAFLGRDRALVTPLAGTTRDFIEEKVVLDGLPVCLVDTAGLRNKIEADDVERLGMERSRKLLKNADIVLLVLDSEDYINGFSADACIIELLSEKLPLIAVLNKHDLSSLESAPIGFPEIPWIIVSAKSGFNIEKLGKLIKDKVLSGSREIVPENGLAPNKRQAIALTSALEELNAMAEDIEKGMPLDCLASRLDLASSHLEEILGLSVHEDLLEKIFSQFCIGK